jgi:segregation and condensation protein B
VGRPILYKTTKEFLLHFGLKDVGDLPSMEEFEKLVAQSFQSDLLPAEDASEKPAASSEAAAAQPSENADSGEVETAAHDGAA